MNILLLNPPTRIPLDEEWEYFFVKAGSRWPFSLKKNIKDSPNYVPFPFFLGYTAALLKNKGFNVKVLDGVALNLTEEGVIERCVRLAPDVTLIESSTVTIQHDLEFAQKIKSASSTQIALCGPHVTVFPQEILRNNSQIDYVIRGEYEITFLELIRSMSDNTPRENIEGLAYRDNGRVVINPEREIIYPLDRLPYPAYELFPENEQSNIAFYWDGFCQRRPAIQMHASRGCPFRCNFCLWNQVMYSNGRYRVFSPKRVVDEMQYCIEKFGAREIYFDDDTFTASKAHVLGICREIKKRRLNIFWSCMGDVIVTDEEMVYAMADSGCIGMKFGVESGNAAILKGIGKPLNLEKVKRIARLCMKVGIKTHATFTLGLWGETKESIHDTMNFAYDLRVDTVQFSITTPFPGTRFYTLAKEKGLLCVDHWSDFDGNQRSIYKLNDITNEEIEMLYQEALKRWYRKRLNDPFWLSSQCRNMIRMIKGMGAKAALHNVSKLMSIVREKNS